MQSMLTPVLDDDHYCYCCGSENPEGLHARFVESPGGMLTTRVTFTQFHVIRGTEVHPGFPSLIMDELAVQMLLYQGVAAVSTALRIHALAPVTVGELVVVRAWRGRSRGRFIEVECDARVEVPGGIGSGSGRLVAAGTIACMEVAAAADGGVERFVANRRNTQPGS